jgi:carboxyl-terminal processing protease
MNNNRRRWIYGIWLALILSSIGVLVRLHPATAVEPNNSLTQESSKQAAEKPEGLIEHACALIEQGMFDEAKQLINSSEKEGNKDRYAGQLKAMIEQWDLLNKKRQEQKSAEYKDELAKFDRLKAGKPASDENELNRDINDVNKPKSVLEKMLIFSRQWLDENDISFFPSDEPLDADIEAAKQQESRGPSSILAAVIRTSEFANDRQKKEMLADPCVLDAISKAKAEAAEFEKKGKWLDSYIACYSLLAAMDPNNKEWTEHAEQLIEKAEIVGSFQDSPCETSKQRFDGVKRRIFVKAVDALNFNYVSKIDYQAMSAKGVRRIESFAEVVSAMIQNIAPNNDSQGQTSEPNLASLGESFKDFKPDTGEIAKFLEWLSSLEQDINNWPKGAGKDRFLAVFDKVIELNLVSAHLPETVVIAQFADASFNALDPYTVIVWPTYVEDFEKAMTNEFSGIGIEITRQKGQLTIGSLLPDTPAYNSGLDAGDVIEKVNGLPTKDMPINCAVKNITGPAGTKVTLSIKRQGEPQLRDITITRAKIVVPSVRGWQRTSQGNWQYMIDEQEKIGYVKITSFSEKTSGDFNKVLSSLEAAGMRGLILDLRYNPGGIFDSAVEVADEFLSEGLIVITRPRFGMPIYESAKEAGTHPDYPMVVLINSGSASASEIVAGALADPLHKRATLVGERTHGKGVVQGITHYPGDGAQLKYTMANWYLPSGQKIKTQDEAKKEGTSDWGVAPDVTVSLRSDELRRMFDIQRDNDVLASAGHDETMAPVKRHTIKETIEDDPQLATGLLVIKSKLICRQARAERTKNPKSDSPEAVAATGKSNEGG